MKPSFPVKGMSTSADIVRDTRQRIRASSKIGKVDKIWTRTDVRKSLQCMGIKRSPVTNRPLRSASFAAEDLVLTIPRAGLNRCGAASRSFRATIQYKYATGDREWQRCKLLEAGDRRQGLNALVILNSVKGRPVRRKPNQCGLAGEEDRRRGVAAEEKELIMERSDDCLHCKDLNAQFVELREQQRILEDQVRSLETRLEDQFRVLNDKYKTEINVFLHRVAQLHEQYEQLSNRCSHAEESIAVLKFIMDKKLKDAPSSSSATAHEPNPEASTAKKNSHIEID